MKLTRKWYPLSRVVPLGLAVTAAPNKKMIPIDPLTGPKQALRGRVVTMDDSFMVRPDAIVYITRAASLRSRIAPSPPPRVSMT